MRRNDVMAAAMLVGVGLLASLLSMPAAASVSQTTPTATSPSVEAAPVLAFVANGQPSTMYSEEYGTYQLYVVSLDEKRLAGLDAPLTPPDGDADSPSWSPDGQRIVYSFSPNDSDASYLEVINADGTDRQRLTQGGVEFSPVWSPDGQTIAYLSYPAGSDINHPDRAIYAMNPDGSNVRLVANATGVREIDWSPDGAHLLVGAVDARENGHLYMLSVEDGSYALLPTGPLSIHGGAWSPGGSLLAYVSGSHILISEDEGQTARPVELTEPMAFALNEAAYAGFDSLDWSPSGRELVAVAFSGALQVAVSTPVPYERVGWQIVVIDVETGAASLVTYGFNNRAPDWRPASESSPR